MSRAQFFVIGSIVIFLLERILPGLVFWPLFIFPVFAILFILTNKNETGEISYIVGASLFFDFFSGYFFGFTTLVLLIIVLAIFFFKTRFNVGSRSLFSLAIYTTIFVFAYFAILSIKSDSRLIISQASKIVTETLTLFLIFYFALHKLTRYRGER